MKNECIIFYETCLVVQQTTHECLPLCECEAYLVGNKLREKTRGNITKDDELQGRRMKGERSIERIKKVCAQVEEVRF